GIGRFPSIALGVRQRDLFRGPPQGGPRPLRAQSQLARRHPGRLSGLGTRLRVADLTLKLVAAGIAAPQMTDAAVVEILAPFRREQRFPALSTRDGGPGPM